MIVLPIPIPLKHVLVPTTEPVNLGTSEPVNLGTRELVNFETRELVNFETRELVNFGTVNMWLNTRTRYHLLHERYTCSGS